MSAENSRAAIYARTATVKAQNEKNVSTGQVAGCTEYIMKQGYLSSQNHIYVDDATSAIFDERPALASLRQAIARHEIDVVVVYTLDRIASSMALIEEFVAETERSGVKIESALEPHLDGTSIATFIQARRSSK